MAKYIEAKWNTWNKSFEITSTHLFRKINSNFLPASIPELVHYIRYFESILHSRRTRFFWNQLFFSESSILFLYSNPTALVWMLYHQFICLFLSFHSQFFSFNFSLPIFFVFFRRYFIVFFVFIFLFFICASTKVCLSTSSSSFSR